MRALCWHRVNDLRVDAGPDSELVGRSPDACVNAVGVEAHGAGAEYAYDRVKHTHRMPREQAPRGSEPFKHKEEGCVRVLFTS